MGSESRLSEFFLMTPWIEIKNEIGKKNTKFTLYMTTRVQRRNLYLSCVGHTWMLPIISCEIIKIEEKGQIVSFSLALETWRNFTSIDIIN